MDHCVHCSLDMEYKPKHVLGGQHTSAVVCVMFSPTGLHVASGDMNGVLVDSSVEDGNVSWKFQGSMALLTIRWVFYRTGEEHIFCGYKDRTMVVFHVVEDGMTISAYKILDSPVECMALQNGLMCYLATGGSSEISIWNAVNHTWTFFVYFCFLFFYYL